MEKIAEHEGKLAIVGPSVLLGMGVREGSELKDKLDEALASMKAAGSLNNLPLKWVGEDASTFK